AISCQSYLFVIDSKLFIGHVNERTPQGMTCRPQKMSQNGPKFGVSRKLPPAWTTLTPPLQLRRQRGPQ
ncbi:hypothetical protein CH063_06007, partial [Colletotrichum higginsianum]